MIFLNGKFLPQSEAGIACSDRGLLLSDGLFETMKSFFGKVSFLNAHWRRFQAGAAFLEIPLFYSLDELKEIIFQLLSRNALMDKEAALRLTLTRGVGARGLSLPIQAKPTIMLSAFPLLPPILRSTSVWIANTRRNELSPLSAIKSLSYLDNVLARREAEKNNADEAVLLNTQGNVAEASAANVFIINDRGVVITPRLEDGALPGITRRAVRVICKKTGIRFLEKVVTLKELFAAKEVFLTNALIGIQPVKRINAHRFEGQELDSSITLKIRNFYENCFCRAG